MYLVTGGCGFIGSHLVDFLIERGYRVRVLDDLSNSSKKYLGPYVEFLSGSITDKKMIEQALEGVKGVFHLAAMISVTESIIHWYDGHRVNCGGTVQLLELAKKLPIVFASSAAVYGDSTQLPHKEESPSRPLSPYAVDKLACEMHAQIAWQLHSTPSISFRFFNVYGPRQNPDSPYSGVISKFSDKILHKEPLTIYGDGGQSRDFIYVKDLVKILVQSMESMRDGAHIYNLCTGKDRTINELADIMGQMSGLTVKKEYTPPRPGEIRFSRGDPSKLLKELGLKAETSLEEGIRLLMEENGNL